MTQAALFMVIFVILFAVHQAWQSVNRCGYCGRVAGRDDDCPLGRA